MTMSYPRSRPLWCLARGGTHERKTVVELNGCTLMVVGAEDGAVKIIHVYIVYTIVIVDEYFTEMYTSCIYLLHE